MVNYTDQPQLAKDLKETNDCFVRALAMAAGISYNEAHQIASAEFGRKERKGTKGVQGTIHQLNQRNRLAHLGLEIQRVNHTWVNRKGQVNGVNIRGFYNRYGKGHYLVLVSGHALAIIDGQIQDWTTKAKHIGRTVQAAYRVANLRQLDLFANC